MAVRDTNPHAVSSTLHLDLSAQRAMYSHSLLIYLSATSLLVLLASAKVATAARLFNVNGTASVSSPHGNPVSTCLVLTGVRYQWYPVSHQDLKLSTSGPLVECEEVELSWAQANSPAGIARTHHLIGKWISRGCIQESCFNKPLSRSYLVVWLWSSCSTSRAGLRDAPDVDPMGCLVPGRWASATHRVQGDLN